MAQLQKVSEELSSILEALRAARDGEISMAGEVASQYVTDHRDKAAYRAIEKQVSQLAKAWDRMIRLVEKTAEQAEKIESSCENFYGC